MLPSSTQGPPHRLLRHVVVVGDFLKRSATVLALPNDADIAFGELRHPVPTSFRRAPFLGAVSIVVGRCSDEEVRGANADTLVADMADEQSNGDLAFMYLVTQAVDENFCSIGRMSKFPIPVGGAPSFPHPTTCALSDSFPKLICEALGHKVKVSYTYKSSKA